MSLFLGWSQCLWYLKLFADFINHLGTIYTQSQCILLQEANSDLCVEDMLLNSKFEAWSKTSEQSFEDWDNQFFNTFTFEVLKALFRSVEDLVLNHSSESIEKLINELFVEHRNTLFHTVNKIESCIQWSAFILYLLQHVLKTFLLTNEV